MDGLRDFGGKLAIVAYRSHKIIIAYHVKCAQTSLYERFGKHWNKKHISYFSDGDHLGNLLRLSDYKKQYQNYLTATFVRNPYDRVVSMFTYSNRFDRSDRLKHYSFSEYIEDLYNSEIGGKIMGKIPKLIHLHYFVNTGVDFVGHQEHLPEDIKSFIELVNSKNPTKPPLEYKGMRRLNRSNAQGYRKFYNNDKKLKELVGKIYKKDLEMFNYNFEGLEEN